MVRKISHSLSLRSGRLEFVCPRVNLLALVSSLALAPACTLVVGERPARDQDAGDDAGREQDADVEEDASLDAGSREDGGTTADAGSASDAGSLDAAMTDAALEAGATIMDGGGADSAIVDAGPAPDCGTSTGTLWYPDGDNDGFGRSAEAVQTCARPASGTWVLNGGDCKDNDLNVRPDQTTYFGVPFRGADGNDSFDYDCSGTEEGNPAQLTLANGCGLLELIACSGRGYLARTRTGSNVNPFCGSRDIGMCMAGALGLGCTTAMSTGDPYECK